MTLINFEIIADELEYRLLKIIISADAPELENKNNSLLLKCAEDCRSLYQTEDKILDVLSSTVGNILEDETALQTLNDSKVFFYFLEFSQYQNKKGEFCNPKSNVCLFLSNYLLTEFVGRNSSETEEIFTSRRNTEISI